MLKIVGNRRGTLLVQRQFVGGTAHATTHTYGHVAGIERLLERSLGNPARGERVICHDCGMLREDDVQVGVPHCLPVERAELTNANFAFSKALLTTKINGKLRFQLVAVGLEEANHAAKVVVVSVCEQ